MPTITIECPIPVFVFGTLRKDGQFDSYLKEFLPTKRDVEICNYQLMEMESKDVYIEKAVQGHPCGGVHGEIYHVTYDCLWRLQHLENSSGAFPKAYELAILDGAKDGQGNDVIALYFALKKPRPIRTGNALKRKHLMDCLREYIDSVPVGSITDDELIREMHKRLQQNP